MPRFAHPAERVAVHRSSFDTGVTWGPGCGLVRASSTTTEYRVVYETASSSSGILQAVRLGLLEAETVTYLESADIRTRSLQQDLSPDQVDLLITLIPVGTQALVLYGSRARDDFLPESDVDILAIVEEPVGSRHSDPVNVSCYTVDQLNGISGTLFGIHLRRDGIVLADRTGTVEAMVRSFEVPDPAQLFGRIRHFARILDVSADDQGKYLAGLIRLGRYLLRSAVYAEALRIKQPCFSVRELAELFKEPELTELLASRPLTVEELSIQTLADLGSRLERLVGQLPANPHGSIARLAVIEWDADRELATLAILAMAAQAQPFDYSELPKVLL